MTAGLQSITVFKLKYHHTIKYLQSLLKSLSISFQTTSTPRHLIHPILTPYQIKIHIIAIIKQKHIRSL